MGKGIDLARPDAPVHAAVIDDFKDQLLIVLVKRLGGEISIPVSEVDDTGQNTLSMKVEGGVFTFTVGRKS